MNEKPEIIGYQKFKKERQAYLQSAQKHLVYVDRMYTCDNILPQIREFSLLDNLISAVKQDYARMMQYDKEFNIIKSYIHDYGSQIIHMHTHQKLKKRVCILRKLLTSLQKKYKSHVPHTDCI
jgi:hypothetical protein